MAAISIRSFNLEEKAAVVQQEYHQNNGLSVEDTAFLASFTDEQRKNVLRKVDVITEQSFADSIEQLTLCSGDWSLCCFSCT